MQHGLRTGRQARPRQGLRSTERHSQRLVVQKQLYIVIHRLLRGKRQLNHKFFFPRSRILKRVSSVEIHFVRAEPQQPFLPVIDMQCRRNPARVNLHRFRTSLALRARGFLSLLLHLDGLFFLPFARDRRRRLPLRRSPSGSHAPGEPRLRVIRSVENGGSQNGPRNRSTPKNHDDRRNPLEHGGWCLDSLRRTSNLSQLVGIVKYFSLQSDAHADLPCPLPLRVLLPLPLFTENCSLTIAHSFPCYPECRERPTLPISHSSRNPRSSMQSLRLNPILNTDSYKLTHWWQYPPDTRHIYSYLESRGGMFGETMLAMLQYIIKSNFAGQVFTLDDVEEARRIAHAHFSGHPKTFNYEGFK